MNDPQFPMRINKYLAWKKYATRRGADALIEAGQVFVNGKKASLGEKVNENDAFEVRGSQKKYRYFAYHKPVGITTHSPQEGEEDILGTIDLEGVFPIGRLDKDSHGLMILTDDGRITDPLLNPDSAHEKEYVVTTTTKLRPSFATHMAAGVDIGDYTTKPATVLTINDYAFRITLTEGKRHQIRRMCSALHVEIRELERIRIENIRLGKLGEGQYRQIEGKELEDFLNRLGIR